MRYLLLLLLISSLPVNGQTWYLKRDISWSQPVSPDKTMPFKNIAAFVNSDYENYNALFPRYFEIIPWHPENPKVKVSFFRAEYQQVMPDAEGIEKFSSLIR